MRLFYGVKFDRAFWVKVCLVLGVWLIASVALGSTTGGAGGSMPWDKGVNTFRASVRMVVCPAMIFIGIVVAAGEMFKEGELRGFGKRGLVSVLAGCMGLGGDALVRAWTSGGLVP